MGPLVIDDDGCQLPVSRTPPPPPAPPYPREPTGRAKATGIDCFAELLRHELQHRTDAIDWWGSPRGYYGVSPAEWLARDWDHDGVPNAIEDLHTGCKYGLLPSPIALGWSDTWRTCEDRPFEKATDLEIHAYYTGWLWKLGSVNKQDWSCGDASKQWHGATCR